MRITVRQLKSLIREATSKREPSEEQMAKRKARYKELQRLTTKELLAKLGRTSRINSATEKTPRGDLITAIIDDEF